MSVFVDGTPDFGPREDAKEKSHEKLIKEGWTYLFDSRVPAEPHAWNALGLWRIRNHGDPQRNRWKVIVEEDQRVLRNDITRGIHGADLISLQDFWDFDLHVELRCSANSGVYLRGRYEIQVNRTPAGADRKVGPSELGGIYGVSAPKVNASKGPGVWQTIDASIRGYTISVWLNGTLIQDKVEITGRKLKGTGSELSLRDGIFSEDPATPGPLFLQGDHGSVEFRNIRVRPVVKEIASSFRLKESGARVRLLEPGKVKIKEKK